MTLPTIRASRSGLAYGDYILRTGQGVTLDLEQLFGQYWYQTRFAGRRPILDLGPGRCWFTRQNPADIIAVDNAPELVEHFSRAGIQIRLGDAYSIPFPEETFEGVFCCWLFEHLMEPDRSMRELYRVLKPGGYACIVVPSPHDMFAFYDDYTHIRPFTPNSLRHLAEGAEFAKWDVEYLHFDRGISYVVRLFGTDLAARYIRFSDGKLRKLGIVNRKQLLLNAWK